MARHELSTRLEQAGTIISECDEESPHPRIRIMILISLVLLSYGGDMTERAVANSDIFPTLIPASADYAFTNTATQWYGYNFTFKYALIPSHIPHAYYMTVFFQNELECLL